MKETVIMQSTVVLVVTSKLDLYDTCAAVIRYKIKLFYYVGLYFKWKTDTCYIFHTTVKSELAVFPQVFNSSQLGVVALYTIKIVL